MPPEIITVIRQAPAESQISVHVVFRGKKPGVYQDWDQCFEQLEGYTKPKFHSYKTLYEAELAWVDWQKRVAVKNGASTFLQNAGVRPRMEAMQDEFAWIEPPSRSLHESRLVKQDISQQQITIKNEPTLPSAAPESSSFSYDLLGLGASQKQKKSNHSSSPPAKAILVDSRISAYNTLPADAARQQKSIYSSSPPAKAMIQPNAWNILYSSRPIDMPREQNQALHSSSPSPKTTILDRVSAYSTPPTSSPPGLGIKRAPNFIDLTDYPSKLWGTPAKRRKTEYKPSSTYKHDRGQKSIMGYTQRTESFDESEAHPLTREERFELDKLQRDKAPARAKAAEEGKIQLTPEQEKVVNLALRKNNLFITGAAGSGKTVTLKEILYRIRKRRNGGNVEVIAPTGIAALPLNGKTTYSFAGWFPDSFREGIEELVKKKKKYVVQRINEMDVLVIEEISMVENHFLERLNRLLQSATSSPLPFGGKQVILLGDFHQLPPVKPFTHCLECGHEIPQRATPACISQKCISHTKASESAGGVEDSKQQQNLKWSDKWAFKAPVWKELKLRHVKLEQIHRQKDTEFQDILNKIRNGVELSIQEWNDLEREKELPKNAFAVRLMSRLAQVKWFNDSQLGALKSPARTWRAKDSVDKLVWFANGAYIPSNAAKVNEYMSTLKEHRLSTDLTLKVGARVVLLYNLDPELGLVNGSQGVVIGFGLAPEGLERTIESGQHKEFRIEAMVGFQDLNPSFRSRPVVRFANGITRLIQAVASSGLRGDANPMDQYVATRTQIPLALAWALSIHKSQGMTLEYVEVSSKDIFESGQLYVALSRATHLNGLKVTGFKRNQMPMDPDVLQFYTETKWEKLGQKGKKIEKAIVIDDD